MTTAVATETRVCRVCGIEYPLEQMGLGKVINGKQYRSWSCVSCETARKVKRPVPYQGEARTCAHDGCTTTLSRYNHGLYCAPHEHLLNELAQPATETPRKEVIQLKGVTIKPQPLPRRKVGAKGRDYAAVVREFLAEEVESAVIEVEGVKNASSLYTMLRLAIAADAQLAGRAYPAVREKRCYLVRIKK